MYNNSIQLVRVNMKKLIDKQTEFLQNRLLASNQFVQVDYEQVDVIEIVKARVKELGISNKELATKLSVSESYISKMLKGERVTRDNVIKLAVVLRLDLEQTNQILKYLAMHILYVKDNRDAVIIFGIHNNQTIEQINEQLRTQNIKLL